MSNSWIVWPEQPSSKSLGGKSNALTALVTAKLPIPPFFTLTPEAFWGSLTTSQATAFRQAKSVEEIVALLPDITLAPDLASAAQQAFERLNPGDSGVAVRSSALDEDSAGHSFAGQLDSFLFVTREQLAQKVAAVWRSGFSQRILAYRRERGLSLIPNPPAVLVQKMIDAETAGVAFAADPVSGRRTVMVVSAVYGLGTSLVSGEADADTYTIDRAGTIISRTIATKRTYHRPAPHTTEGVTAVTVESTRVNAPVLTDEQVLVVGKLAQATSRHFGQPQDIEWACEGGNIYLLQSRPITTLAAIPDPDGCFQLWDNSNIAESYTGVTTPLTFTFARHAYEGVYQEFCRLMRVSEEVIADHRVMYANMLGLIRGRVYYNLLNWYRMLALLPGFTINRPFMEQMMGVKEGLPEHLVKELQTATWQAKLRDILRLTQAVGGLIRNHFTLQTQIRRFYERLNTALAPHTPPLEQMRPDELATYFRQLERQLLTRWDAPLVNDFFAMIYYGVLRKLCAKIDPRGTLQNDLLCAEGGIISTEPAKRIRTMATLALRHEEWVDRLCMASLSDIKANLAEFPDLAAEYQSYLDKFGHRCIEELKLESTTLHDDPLSLLRSIGSMARRMQSGISQESDVEAQMRAQAENQVRKALAYHPLRRMIFNWVLKHTRARVRDRENLRFERTRLFGRVREIFVELGKRLHAEGILAHPRDIFYLNLEEILGFIEGTATCTQLHELAQLRKSEFQRYQTELPVPADRIATYGAVYLGNTFTAEPTQSVTPPASDGQMRNGIGCCPGLVRGRARVILQPRGAEIRQGEILIASRTDPGWIMLFPAAAGVAVEHGSLLSHTAIVARELGIPTVVSVSGITSWLQTGDMIELDGKAGTIRRLAEETAP